MRKAHTQLRSGTCRNTTRACQPPKMVPYPLESLQCCVRPPRTFPRFIFPRCLVPTLGSDLPWAALGRPRHPAHVPLSLPFLLCPMPSRSRLATPSMPRQNPPTAVCTPPAHSSAPSPRKSPNLMLLTSCPSPLSRATCRQPRGCNPPRLWAQVHLASTRAIRRQSGIKLPPRNAAVPASTMDANPPRQIHNLWQSNATTVSTITHPVLACKSSYHLQPHPESVAPATLQAAANPYQTRALQQRSPTPVTRMAVFSRHQVSSIRLSV